MTRTSNTLLNNSGKCGHPCLVPDLRGNAFSFHQEENITIIGIYAPNIGAHQYVRQMLTAIKGEISSNTIIVGDFYTPTYTNG